MFWVMGGISKVLDKVDMYKAFFSDIKNTKTLWEKSILVFDRDRLTDTHLALLQDDLLHKKLLPNYSHREYTQESVFLTDLHLMAILLSDSYEEMGQRPLEEVEAALQASMTVQESIIRSRFNADCVADAAVKQYKGQYLEKFDKVFGRKVIVSDIKLERELQSFYAAHPAAQLSNKDDLVEVVNRALEALKIVMTVDESVAYTLAQHSTMATMYPQWNDMVRFLES